MDFVIGAGRLKMIHLKNRVYMGEDIFRGNL